MKLFKTAVGLAGVTHGIERGLDPLQSIAFAHSRVRQGFLLPEMDDIIDQNERLLREVFDPDFATRLVSLEEMVSRSENITSSFLKQGNCDSSFPTYDGSCNHPNGKGRSMKEYERLVAADYCDGKQEPRCSKRRTALPDERKISLQMGKSKRQQTTSNTASVLFTMWGQFLTHDIIQTPDVGKGQVPCDCTAKASCKNIRLQNDPVLKFRCMFIIRSSSKLIPGSSGVGQREQVNQQSAFIDGSVVYGFTKKHKDLLTAKDGIHLKMNSNRFGDFLPNVDQFNDRGIKQNFQTADVFNDKGHPEFVAGDTRVLENPVLSSFHTMFARLHNLAADEFQKERLTQVDLS